MPTGRALAGLRMRQFGVASMRGEMLFSTVLRLAFRLAVIFLPSLPSYSRAGMPVREALCSGPGS